MQVEHAIVPREQIRRLKPTCCAPPRKMDTSLGLSIQSGKTIIEQRSIPMQRIVYTHFIFLVGFVLFGSAEHLIADEVSFTNDVMAVLSKAGCNQGVCHGNKHGKGGLKLSLRGDDPPGDFEVLTRSLSSRRINRLNPELSIILLKATMSVSHEGGRRFDKNSQEYSILRDWILAGTPRDPDHVPQLQSITATPTRAVLTDPQDEIQLQVEAEFSDGSRRDVTSLAVYETSNRLVEVEQGGLARRIGMGETVVNVRFLNRQVPVELAFIPQRPDFAWNGPQPANFVDENIFAKLQSLQINPSEVCSDSEFVRRAYLDLLGVIPTAAEARRFVEDDRSDKRSRLIDALLQRPEFADFWTLKWSDLLRSEEKTLDRKGVEHFHAWIRSSIAQNKPLDQFVRELIVARGSTYQHAPANFYRAMRDPLTRGESTAQLFLGIRLQCAKCHNHPFDNWTQDDYYGWANLFARVNYKILENKRRDGNDKHEFNGEQIVFIARQGEVTNPRIGKPTPPRFLGDTAEEVQPNADRLVELANWLTHRKNLQFARTQVNFIWFQLLGRGIVHPIDDFRATNPPANPPLLEALSKQFIASGYDLRQIIRVIMNSQTYQFSSTPNLTNEHDEINFSHSAIRRLTAEQLLDALAQASGATIVFNGYPAGMRASELPGVRAVRLRDKPPSLGDQFLKLFGKPARLTACTCERTEASTLGQTFQMVSGPLINQLLTQPENQLFEWLKPGRPDEEIIGELYWAALSRAPSAEEMAAVKNHLATNDNRRKALEDVAWAVLNSNEFLLRR